LNIRDKIDEGHRRLLAALAKAPYIPPDEFDAMTRVSPARRERPVSPAELRVIECLSHGLTTDMAAEVLGISHHTVRSHLSVVRAKLAAKNQAHVVAIAIRRGLIR
jgi:DNA-binding CsgD family transcriptional regulator